MGGASASRPPWAAAICAAWAARTGASKSRRSGSSTPKVSAIRDTIRVTRREWPPRSKKLSFAPTSEIPSIWLQIPASSSSTGVRGAT